MSEICMLLSTMVSVAGFTLQLFLAFHRIRRLESQQRTTRTVVSAVSEAQRVVAGKVENIEKTGD